MIAGGLCALALLGSQAMAARDTGGYPYAGKPCIRTPFAASGTKANWCPNFEWGAKRNDVSAANVISPYGYYYRNCTDYVAWRLDTNGISPAQYKGLGNAKKWATPPAKNKLFVDNQPAIGAVAVRPTGTYGHLAYVEDILPDGQIRVSQYNKAADGNYSVQTGQPAVMGFTRFVHFELYQTPSAAPVIAVPSTAPVPEPPAPESPVTVEPQIVSSIPTVDPVPAIEAVVAVPTALPTPSEPAQAQPQPQPEQPPAVLAAVTDNVQPEPKPKTAEEVSAPLPAPQPVPEPIQIALATHTTVPTPASKLPSKPPADSPPVTTAPTQITQPKPKTLPIKPTAQVTRKTDFWPMVYLFLAVGGCELALWRRLTHRPYEA